MVVYSRFRQYEVDNIHTLGIYIYKLMTSTLEQDLVSSQTKIITLLTEYQRTSEQIIKSTYMNELHTLLNSIASFDHQKIKQCQNIIKDKTALQYLDNIADKIRNAQQDKIKQVMAESKIVDKSKSNEKLDKPEQKQKKDKKQGGLFDFVKRKFSGKQKKASEMILPEEEPKCYYDPVTKSYVFQGDEPVVPKEIPKPPSTSERKAKEETKKKQDDSELGQLTAPPAFKRKSTAAGKGKVKIKQQIQVVKVINEPLSFARVLQEISLNYNEILEKVRMGTYQSRSHTIYNDSEKTHQFTRFIQKSIEFSEQIHVYETKNLEKWTKILTSESRELKIMEKVIREMNESANIYSTLLNKLEITSIRHKDIKQEGDQMINNDIKKVNQLIQTDDLPTEVRQVMIIKEDAKDELLRQKILQIQNELESTKYGNQELKSRNSQLQIINKESNQVNHRLQMIIIQERSKNAQLTSKDTHLQQELDYYRQENRRLSQSIRQREQFYLSQASRLNHEITKIAYDCNNKITTLQAQKSKLQNDKIRLKVELKNERSKHTESHDIIIAEMQRQKVKIEEYLRFTQQRQRKYLKVLKDMQQHEINIQEYDTIDPQDGLMRTIIKKKLKANKNPEIDNQQQGKIQVNTSNSTISQLSDIIGAITQTNLDRLEQFSKGYAKLLQRYTETKNLFNKVKNNSTNENICLNRSIAKLKGLFQICKIGKQEAQQKYSHLELECDRLKKKLNHYKQQDNFNKSYITRLRPSKISNQDESILSLHEQKEQLTTQIDDLHKEIQVKNQTLKKNQVDLEDLLINYEKNQQKLLEIQTKYKDGQRQRKQHRQTKEKLQNKIKLLELKLKNQRQRYDQIQNQEESRLKSMQASYEKKLKVLKIELDQSYQREIQIKVQHQQIIKQFKTRINLLQQSHQKIQNEFRDAIKLKSNENGQLTSIIQDLNQRLQIQRQQKKGLNERNFHLMQTETQLNRKLNEIIDEHLKEISIHRDSQQNMNNIIATLLEKYSSFKLEQQQFKEHYQSKLYMLQNELEISQLQSNDLLNQINLYSSHIVNLNSVIQDINRQHMKEKQAFQIAKKQITIERQKIEQQLGNWKAQCNERLKQNKELEQVIQRISQDMARLISDRECLRRDKTDLQQRLMFKDRQLETLNNEVNKIHQDLLVKTQQLEEQKNIMLQHEEQAVMKREELDQLQNQLSKMQQEMENQIKQLNICKKQKDEVLLYRSNINAEKDEIIEALNNKINNLEGVIVADQATIMKQTQQISLLNKQKEQISIQSLKKNGEIESQNIQIQQLQRERQAMKSKIQQLQSILDELHLKLDQKQKKTTLTIQQQPKQNEQQPKNEQIQKQIEYLYDQIYKKDNEIDNLIKQLKEKQITCTELIHEKNWLSSALGNLKESHQLKDQEIDQLKGVVKNLEHLNQTEKDEKLKLVGEIKKLTQSNQLLQLDFLSINAQKIELQSIKKQLNRRVQQLSKRRFLEHESFVQRQALSESQIKEEGMIIQDLLQDIRAKDQMIIEKQREIVTEQRLISELESEKKMKQDEMLRICRMLEEKDKLIDQLKKSHEQKCTIIAQKEDEIIRLNKNLTEMSQIIEMQQAQLEKNMHQELNEVQDDQLKQLRLKLQTFENEKNQIMNKIGQFNERQIEYNKKIANLEQRPNQVLISGDYQELQQKYKALLDENTALMNEKVELMKSNNYLVSINQKLVGQKSSSNMRELHKAQSHINPLINKASEVKQRPTSEVIESKPENKGFFGALSSLFLTPTQADRLRK